MEGMSSAQSTDEQIDQLSAGLVRRDSVRSASSFKGKIQNQLYAIRSINRPSVNLQIDDVFTPVTTP